jgi:3-oxoadipate enol-lactonase
MDEQANDVASHEVDHRNGGSSMTRFANSNGVRIAYETHGSGEPVLLIMGFGAPRQAWLAQIPALAERFHVVALDNRNAGESEVTPDCSMQLMAADAMAVLDAEGIGQAHVVGLSMGGMIAQHVALEYPHRVRSLALCTTTCGGPHAEPTAGDVLAALMGLQGASLTDPEVLEKFGWILFPRDWLAANSSRLKVAMAPLAAIPRPSMAAVQAQLMAILSHDTYERLPAIAHRTLVLHGTDDVLIPPGNATLLAERIPNRRLEWIPGSGHGFNFQEPDVFNRILIDFLSA